MDDLEPKFPLRHAMADAMIGSALAISLIGRLNALGVISNADADHIFNTVKAQLGDLASKIAPALGIGELIEERLVAVQQALARRRHQRDGGLP